ncbi:MAG: 3'(2'),5'-bisphosphate nucleotidase CysQ [Bacteroidota bacterium]|nr:3'(2'),5'-bisphosphate nucleotidase CysQ [Bacteroidota bacterium]
MQMTELLIPVLRKAAAAILEIYADVDRFNTQIKEDQSPLTEADLRANDIIRHDLNLLYPGVPVISEEMKHEEYAERRKYTQYFLVDPLDGTKEFIKRNGEFTINIAYVEENTSVGGFVCVPASGNIYVAEKHSGAYRIDPANQKKEIQSLPFYFTDRKLNVVASRSHRDPDTERVISQLTEPEIISVGSSLKLILIAEGKAHFYPRFGPTMEWDTAAAQCILEEAGGSLLNADTLLPFTYNKESLLNASFLAFGKCLDPEAIQGFRIEK